MAYSKDICDVIKNLFKEIDWKYNVCEYSDRCIFHTNTQIDEDTRISKLFFSLNVQENDVSIISTSSIKADSKNISRMAEFICRANYGLKDGNFELDYDDGTIRYKSYIYVEEHPLEQMELVRSIVISTEMWMLYGDGIIDLLGSERDVKEIIAQIEHVEI